MLRTLYFGLSLGGFGHHILIRIFPFHWNIYFNRRHVGEMNGVRKTIYQDSLGPIKIITERTA